nr:hypothetical protein [Tanacetum cinerariifolium]
MENTEDASNPTTALDMALKLVVKAFQLNNSTPTNNNQRSSSNPCNSQIAQSGINMDQDRQMGIQNVKNQNRLSVISWIANQYRIGNVVTTRDEANGIQLISEEFDFMAAVGACVETVRANANYTLENNLQQASTFGTQSDKAPVHDSDESAEVHLSENCYGNAIFNMFTQEEQYTELLEPIPETHQVQQNNSNVIYVVSNVKQGEGTVEQHSATVEETRAKFIRDLKSLAKEADESLVKHKALELEIERLLRAIVSQDIMFVVQNNSIVDTLNLQTELERMKEDTFDPLPQKLKNGNVELKFQVRNYEKENDHLKTAHKNLFNSINVTRAQTKTIIDSLQTKLHDTINENSKLRAQLLDKISKQKDTIKGTSTNTKFLNQSTNRKPSLQSLRNMFVVRQPNAFQYERLTFSKTRVPRKVDKTNNLSNPVTSNSVPTTKESKVVENDKMIASGIFRIYPFKASRVDNFMPNKHVKASVMTKPITFSQPHVITKNDINSKTNGFSPKDVKSTTRTRRPLPRNNPKNYKVPFKSKSSWLLNNLEKIEENHKNLQSSSNRKHISSECNNIKLAIQNAKYEVVCAMCKQCLITVNHDVCVLNYVNDMNSHALNNNANVSNVKNQKKHKPNVRKPTNVGSKERLASPKPSTPRSCLSNNTCTSNPQEPIYKQFPSLTFSMKGCQNWLDTLLIPLLSEYKLKDKEHHEDNECDELLEMVYAAVMPRLMVDRRDEDGGEAGGVKRLWRQQVVSEGGGVVVVGGVVVPAAMVAVHGDGGLWIL